MTVRWSESRRRDLDRVELVLNRKHSPRSHSDGRVLYHGLAQTFVLTLSPGQTAHLALYAIDRSGNISSAVQDDRLARGSPSDASAQRQRGPHGATVEVEPRDGVVYYNLQVFQRGKRVLVAWPRTASYRFPADKLQPGTYVWFVWPALGRFHSTPQFGTLIGRATFVYAH